MNDREIQVECYSGFKADERPFVFMDQGVRYKITDIVDRWYEGGQNSGRSVINYFKVKTSDGGIFLMGYHPETDSWFMREPG